MPYQSTIYSDGINIASHDSKLARAPHLLVLPSVFHLFRYTSILRNRACVEYSPNPVGNKGQVITLSSVLSLHQWCSLPQQLELTKNINHDSTPIPRQPWRHTYEVLASRMMPRVSLHTVAHSIHILNIKSLRQRIQNDRIGAK